MCSGVEFSVGHFVRGLWYAWWELAPLHATPVKLLVRAVFQFDWRVGVRAGVPFLFLSLSLSLSLLSIGWGAQIVPVTWVSCCCGFHVAMSPWLAAGNPRVN